MSEMSQIKASAAVCINENKEILMVLQGKAGEEKTWSVPSGLKKKNESFKQCCKREVKEETGYKVEIVRLLYTKKINNSIVKYFKVNIIDSKKKIKDPDQLIYDIRWIKIEEINKMNLTFPKDKKLLKKWVE